MVLLKLGSIYKKKIKKEPSTITSLPPPQPALPNKLEPISLDLNFNLNNSLSIDTSATITKSTTDHVNKNNTAPAGSGSLFDDIFAELGTATTSTSKKGIFYEKKSDTGKTS
jgi:hypothetical protein